MTPADYIAEHNAGRHRKHRDARCSLCVKDTAVPKEKVKAEKKA